MRVMVTGGRDYSDAAKVFHALDAIHTRRGPITLLIEGGASGADRLANTWARLRGIPLTTFQADWARSGKRAGPERNRRMIQEARPELVMAFPGGAGTADAVRQARAANIEVLDLMDVDA